ncbi:hypothetical protein MMC08_001957 [Hypocenomyce scalaris]|nr:hypothetical protein [Hypocenomyce scalaris]
MANPKSPSLLARRLQHLLTPLHPLFSITTGTPHPSFPRTLLAYHLLTEAELDSLAHFYHQRTPCEWSASYPASLTPGKWWRAEGGVSSMDVVARVQRKRRRFGRFVGLRDCESPVVDEGMGEGFEGDERGVEEVRRRVDREVRRKLEKAEEEEVWRRKFGWIR